MTNSNTRLLYFDGLRGIVALMVLNEHFLKIFAPASFLDEAQWPVSQHGLAWLSFPPFNLLSNGAPAVTLFFVLSGWVLSRYIQSQERVHWLGEGLKRYVRLMVPCLASLLLIFGVMQFGDMGAAEVIAASGSKEHTFQSFDMGFMDVVTQGLYGTILLEDFRLNPPLWTISVEFYGALFIFSMAWLWSWFIKWKLIGEGGRLAAQVIIPLAMLFVATNSLTFGFFLGMLLHTTTSVPKIDSILVKYRRVWVAPALTLGLVLFAYMIRGSFQNPYASISFWGFNKLYEYAYNAIGAGIILLSVYYSPRLQALLERESLLWLGKLSFSLYLTHYIVLMSVAAKVKTIGSSMHSSDVVFLTGVVSIVSVIILAMIFQRFVDQPAIWLASRIKNVLTKTKRNQSKESVLEIYS